MPVFKCLAALRGTTINRTIFMVLKQLHGKIPDFYWRDGRLAVVAKRLQ